MTLGRSKMLTHSGPSLLDNAHDYLVGCVIEKIIKEISPKKTVITHCFSDKIRIKNRFQQFFTDFWNSVF